MILDKEYPATHSMSTAWYCVDEDDNVAIFSCEDNGPKPHGVKEDIGVGELCFDVPVENVEGIKYLNLTDEQVLELFTGQWKEKVSKKQWWHDVVLQIDLNREADFFEYIKRVRKWRLTHCKYGISEDEFIPKCLSKKYGIYLVSIPTFRDGLKNRHAKYLLKNKIVLRFCDTPYDLWDDSPFIRTFPYYLYDNEYDSALPHKRRNLPKFPVKLNQIPEPWRSRVIKLKLKFVEAENIQIAEKTLCYSSSWLLDAYNGFFYAKAVMPSGEECYILTDDTSTDPKLEKSDSEIAERWKSPLRILPQSEVEKLLKREHNQYLLYD